MRNQYPTNTMINSLLVRTTKISNECSEARSHGRVNSPPEGGPGELLGHLSPLDPMRGFALVAWGRGVRDCGACLCSIIATSRRSVLWPSLGSCCHTATPCPPPVVSKVVGSERRSEPRWVVRPDSRGICRAWIVRGVWRRWRGR